MQRTGHMFPFLPILLLNNAARKSKGKQNTEQIFFVLLPQVHARLRFQLVHCGESIEIPYAECPGASGA